MLQPNESLRVAGPCKKNIGGRTPNYLGLFACIGIPSPLQSQNTSIPEPPTSIPCGYKAMNTWHSFVGFKVLHLINFHVSHIYKQFNIQRAHLYKET